MWRLRKNNLVINEKDKLFVHKVHLERLLHAKTHIQNKGPDIPYFMKNKLSKKETMRVKERKRCYENYLRGNIKRQHIANPNIRFATFSQFKKNISRNYILRRSNSAKTFRNNYEPKTDPLKMEKNDKNNYSNFSNIVPNKNYNNRLKKNKRNNNNISSNSTATASKMGRSLSRCQSAFILRNKNNF